MEEPAIAPIQESYNTKLKALENAAQSISLVNGPLFIIGQGPLPTIILGIKDITNTLQTNNERGFIDPFYAKDLMYILIGKAGLLSLVPVVGKPVADALGDLQSAVDSKASQEITKLQEESKNDEAEKLSKNLNDAKASISLATNQYKGIAGNVA